MGYWNTFRRDIKNDSEYGDIELVGNDLAMNTTPLQILKNTVVERFKTNLDDFVLNPNYGANLETFIGKGIDRKLIQDLETRLRYALTYDDYLNSTEIEIISIILNNSVKIFIYLKQANQDDLQLTTVLYDSEGITLDK